MSAGRKDLAGAASAKPSGHSQRGSARGSRPVACRTVPRWGSSACCITSLYHGAYPAGAGVPGQPWCPQARCPELEPDDGKLSSPVVRPGKADVSSRSQSCRGKNRKPRSWRAGRRETKGLKPLDNLTWRVRASFRAVTIVNARWPRKCIIPEAEPATVRAKAARLVATD
jgi:hypothetical protein